MFFSYFAIAKNRSKAPAASWEDEEHFSYKENDSWASEVEHFFDAILENRMISNGNSGDALKVMTIVDQIYEYRNKT